MAETTPRAAARTAKPITFFSYNADDTPLFSINKGVPLETLVEHAQCFMHAVESSVLHAAEEVDHPSCWAAHYLAKIAIALIESMQCAIVEEKHRV